MITQKSGKVSKRRLETFCLENNIPIPMYEAFGKKVHAFWFKLGDRAEEVVAKLREAGLNISTDYYDGDIAKGVEATNISYFKAWHWDE